jgi:hypothetical protein
MHPAWVRWQKRLAALASGGITLGIFQSFSLINWPVFITQLLVQWLSVFVTLLLGGTVNQGLGGTGTSGF